MPFTRTNLLHLIRLGAFILVFLIVGAYAIWRSLDYARGPRIEVFSPTDGSATSSARITIRGLAERVSFLALNGRPITTDEDGNFRDLVLIFPGLNKLTLMAHDQFGRQTQTEIDIVGSEQSD